MHTGHRQYRLPILLFLLAGSSLSAQDTVILDASQDNTLYETAMDTSEDQFEVSNGSGSYTFSGRTGLDAGYKLRRSLLKFDLTSVIPADAIIVFAEISIYQSKAAPGSPPVSMAMHRVLQSWGEAGSDAFGAEGQGIWAEAGDATWHHRIYPDELWSTAGGSFAATASAATTVGQQLQSYTWTCTSALLDDLNGWLITPSNNFGWIMVGGEGGGFSAHRFSSRENSNTDQRPKLTLIYQSADDLFRDGFEATLDCL